MLHRMIVTFLFVCFLCACSHTSGNTHKISNSEIHMRRMLVLVQVGDGTFIDHFAPAMIEYGHNCGLVVQVEHRSPKDETLSLNDDAAKEMVNKTRLFQADHVLNLGMQIVSQQGANISATFNAALKSYPSNQMVWGGVFKTSPSFIGYSGETMAHEIINKMQEDHVLDACLEGKNQNE